MLSLAACSLGESDDKIENSVWDELEKMGKLESEDGRFYLTITLPADFVSEELLEDISGENKSEEYVSATVNPDGSVSFKMTKKQHKAMLEGVRKSLDAAFKELIVSPDLAFTEISSNEDLTVFDAHLSSEEVGMTESFMALGFYIFGGMYSVFSGQGERNITVNFYSPDGELIKTMNSSDLDN